MADRKAVKRDASKGPAKPAFTLSTAWAFVILTLLVIVFFNQVSLGGKTFVAPDATQPVGFVRMGEQALYHDHVYPLWNPYVFLGMPSFGSGAYNPLMYPPDWPLAAIAKVVPLPDLTWMLLYFALGACFCYLLAREWGAKPEGALIGAAAFVFAPNLVAVGSHGHGSQLVDSAYVPLMLWLAARWMRRGGLENLGWLALAGGFQLLRGHVQICFYTWFAVALYVGVDWLATFRAPGQLVPRTLRALAVPLAAGLAFGLAGVYNLPLRDYARYSIRGGGADGGVGMDYATQWSLAPYELPSFVVPSYVGFGGQTYWGGMPFTDYPNGYLGMVAVLFALPAFLAGGVPRVFALGLAVLSLLIAFGHYGPVYGFLYSHLPLFNKFRIPVMVIVLFQVAAAMGTAWGWSAVLDRVPQAAGKAGRPPALDRLLPAAAIALLALLVIGVFGQDLWRAGYIASAQAHHPGFPPDAAAADYAAYVPDLAKACVLGLLALGLAWLARRGTLAAAPATALALALVLFELWPVSGRVMEPVIGDVSQHGLDYGRDDVVDFLEKAGPQGTFRVLPLEEYQSNRYAGFGIATVGGYHPAKPRLYQDFFESHQLDTMNLPWLRLLNVRYLVVSQPIAQLPPYLREAFRGAGGVVYENLFALPRVTVLGAYRVVTPAKAIFDSVGAGRANSAEMTWLDADPHLTLGPVTGASASVVSYRLNDVTVDVDTPGPALVRMADLYYPDWVASVDGHDAPILRADYLLRAVAVPAGHHRIAFHFRSPAVRRGLFLSLASLLVALSWIGAGMWVARRKAGGPPVAPRPEGA
ncbi:MAG TPA: hypothetical protein VL332_06900 [Candidatus Saccharimonadaceae bacterium]|jgi:hypothetical protein|nr:hypothetical protein [Candidatus Saccharimonadaceae bacterium]